MCAPCSGCEKRRSSSNSRRRKGVAREGNAGEGGEEGEAVSKDVCGFVGVSVTNERGREGGREGGRKEEIK